MRIKQRTVLFGEPTVVRQFASNSALIDRANLGERSAEFIDSLTLAEFVNANSPDTMTNVRGHRQILIVPLFQAIISLSSCFEKWIMKLLFLKGNEVSVYNKIIL